MDMKKAWAMAREKAESEGGKAKDYLGEMMKLQLQEVKRSSERKEVSVPSAVNFRLDELHKGLVVALMERGDYKNTSDFFRQAVRYMASRELGNEELMEILMDSVMR